MKSRAGQRQREEKRRVEERRSEKRKSQKKEDADARKGRKVAKHCGLPMICGSGGSKSRLAKAAGAEPSGQMRDEKVHAVVARSTFPSQNVQKKMLGPLLEVEMSKKCTPLWREAHFEVKMLKNPGVRTTFGSWDVETVHAVVARSTFRSQNVKNTRGSDHFWRFRCRFAWQAQGIVHLVKSAQTWRFCSIFNYYTTTTPSLHSTTLHYTTLHYTKLRYTTLDYTTLHFTTLHYTTLHYIPLHYTIFHYTTLHYIAQTTTILHLHYATLHYTNYTALH